MKGIAFLGCSFTWGQGLYYYSGLDTLKFSKDEYTFNQREVTHAQIMYKNKFRFARLVADEFKTFELGKNINGGSEDHSFEYFDRLFITNFCHEDFSYIILQISHIFRNSFIYEIDGMEYKASLDPRHERLELDNPFYKWYDTNNMTEETWKDMFIKQQVERIHKKLKFYESKGIKSKIITWQEDVIPYIKNDLFLNEKFVTLEYENKTFESISLLQKEYENMTIKYDYDFFGEAPPLDHHPSKLCHKVIANSLIKNIKKTEEHEHTSIHTI
jgi:hypothetical protein